MLGSPYLEISAWSLHASLGEVGLRQTLAMGLKSKGANGACDLSYTKSDPLTQWSLRCFGKPHGLPRSLLFPDSASHEHDVPAVPAVSCPGLQ